ncbi:MAG: mechanosensitive ion channel family protein [Thermodesulfobacteriota bacterium]|nr:mechanosensitive ion channel family protein [Thermodesulfobacteriota bacterium]
METALMSFLQVRFFGNTVRDYLISIVIIAATILLAILVNRFLKKRLHGWAQRTDTELDELIVKRIFTPGVYILVVLGLALAKSYLNLPARVSLWLYNILLVLGLAVFFLMVIRFVQGLVEVLADEYKKRLKQRQPPDLAEQIRTVERIKKQVREIAGMVLALLALLTILSNLGVDLKAIWASLGIGGIALVVAVKEPLSNLVGRMYIFGTGIFDEGHFIVFNEWSGTVKRISMFRTYMELFSDMTTVSIPNSDFVKGVVKTYYGRTKFMYKWDLDVPYNVPADTVQELVVKLRELVLGKPEVNPDSTWIYIERLDRYSKVVRVWFQVHLPDWAASLFYGNQVLHDIQLLFESMGLDFAFPTQTLHLKTESALTGPGDFEPGPITLPEAGKRET